MTAKSFALKQFAELKMSPTKKWIWIICGAFKLDATSRAVKRAVLFSICEEIDMPIYYFVSKKSDPRLHKEHNWGKLRHIIWWVDVQDIETHLKAEEQSVIIVDEQWDFESEGLMRWIRKGPKDELPLNLIAAFDDDRTPLKDYDNEKIGDLNSRKLSMLTLSE